MRRRWGRELHGREGVDDSLEEGYTPELAGSGIGYREDRVEDCGEVNRIDGTSVVTCDDRSWMRHTVCWLILDWRMSAGPWGQNSE